jgi:hypothetical protein
MKKENNIIGKCLDCDSTGVHIINTGMYKGLCEVCKRRKQNAKSRRAHYIPYKQLSEEEKRKIEIRRIGQRQRTNSRISPTTHDDKNDKIIEKPIDSLSDSFDLVDILRNYGCSIPEENLKCVLNVLMNTDKLKDIFMAIATNDNQQAILDLEQALNVVERKLQHDWEYNDFQSVDDIKFKRFLKMRRSLKGSIFFWKKLYQTNCIIEMQRAWNAYTQDPNDKILLAGDKIDSAMKRYQISTESISTLLNTRRPFTRVFYATDKKNAYDMFVKWMADRQLHENKAKTIITELKGDEQNAKES